MRTCACTEDAPCLAKFDSEFKMWARAKNNAMMKACHQIKCVEAAVAKLVRCVSKLVLLEGQHARRGCCSFAYMMEPLTNRAVACTTI